MRSVGTSSRPWVLAHNVASLDGRLAPAPGALLLQGDERWSAIAGNGDPYARLITDSAPDAILEGSGSFVVEGESGSPLPVPAVEARTALHEDFLPEAVVGRAGHRGWFVVVDGRGRVRWEYKEFPDPAWAGWHLLVVACQATPIGYLGYLRAEQIPYVVTGDQRVDLRGALERLADRFGVRRLLLTGGGRLGGAMLRAGLIDELDLEFVAALIGGDTTPALFDGYPLQPDEWPTLLEIRHVRHADGRVLVRAKVRREPDTLDLTP